MKNAISLMILIFFGALLAGCNSEPAVPTGQSVENPLGDKGGQAPGQAAEPKASTTVTPAQTPKGPEDANALVREGMKKSGN